LAQQQHPIWAIARSWRNNSIQFGLLRGLGATAAANPAIQELGERSASSLERFE